MRIILFIMKDCPEKQEQSFFHKNSDLLSYIEHIAIKLFIPVI